MKLRSNSGVKLGPRPGPVSSPLVSGRYYLTFGLLWKN